MSPSKAVPATAGVCGRAGIQVGLKVDWNGTDSPCRHDKEVLDGLARLEQCLRGETPCPERPLIVSNWWFMRQARLGGQAGEEVWMFEVVCFTYGAYADSEADVVEAEGFTIVADHRMARILQLSQALNESLLVTEPMTANLTRTGTCSG